MALRLLRPDAMSDAIGAYTEHKQQTQPSWLDGKRNGAWSKRAKQEAWRWWVRKNGLTIEG